MTLEEMRAAFAKKQARAKELVGLIAAEQDTTKLEALTAEAKTNSEERATLGAQINAELRKTATDAINSNPMTIGDQKEKNDAEKEIVLSKRSAIAMLFGHAARKTALSDVEKRAVDKALTTTAETFVAASTSVDGVNNGGIFIKTSILLDLLREDAKLTPIMNDILFTNVKGLTAYPYRASRGTANAKAEGKGTADDQMEWKNLELVKGYLQIKIPVTDELLDLTDFDFGQYLADQIAMDLAEDWSTDFIYGSGTSNHIAGITLGLTAKTYTAGKETAAIETAIKALTGKLRRGAKIYAAQDVFDNCRFAKDSNGDYIVPFFSNDNITVAGTLSISVDETLKAGEFIVGNVSRNYKVNLLNPLHLEKDRDADAGVTTYIVKQHAAGKAIPGAFIYSKLSA